MLEDSINFNPDQVKVHRFKSAKIIPSSINSKQQINKISRKKSYSYDNINKKLESKFNNSKSFPISSLVSYLKVVLWMMGIMRGSPFLGV
jgi:hypothetical protein